MTSTTNAATEATLLAFELFQASLNAELLFGAKVDSTRRPAIFTLRGQTMIPTPECDGGEPYFFIEEEMLTPQEFLDKKAPVLEVGHPTKRIWEQGLTQAWLLSEASGDDSGLRIACPDPHGEYPCDHDMPTFSFHEAIDLYGSDPDNFETLLNHVYVDDAEQFVGAVFNELSHRRVDYGINWLRKESAEVPGLFFLTRGMAEIYLEEYGYRHREFENIRPYAHYVDESNVELRHALAFLSALDLGRSNLVIDEDTYKKVANA